MNFNERISFLKALVGMYEAKLYAIEASKRDPRIIVNKEEYKRIRLLLQKEMLRLEKEID